MLNRDRRYVLIRTLFNDGKIHTFNEIFGFVPKTIVANDLGKKVDRFNKLMNKVEKFTLEEIFQIGRLCDLEEGQILQLVMEDYFMQKKTVDKPKKINYKTNRLS